MEFRDVSDYPDHAVRLTKRFNRIGHRFKSLWIQRPKALVDEDTVQLDRAGSLLHLFAQFKSK